jgi:hypothetical protein
MLFLLHISSWIAWRHGEIIDVDFNFLGPSKKGIHTVYTSWPRQQVVYACTYVPHHVLQCTHNNTLACFVQGHTNIYAPWVISKGISLLEPPPFLLHLFFLPNTELTFDYEFPHLTSHNTNNVAAFFQGFFYRKEMRVTRLILVRLFTPPRANVALKVWNLATTVKRKGWNLESVGFRSCYTSTPGLAS